MTYTEEQIHHMFIQEIRNVWSNSDNAVNYDAIKVQMNDQPVLFRISWGQYDNQSWAIENHLRRRIPMDKGNIDLYVSPRALELPEDDFRAFLRHEAIHFGYPRHDTNFRRVAEFVNAPFTEKGFYSNEETIITYDIKYQPSKGKRFIKFDSTTDYEKARKIAQDYSRENNVRVSVEYDRLR